METINATCIDCSQGFEISVGEQKFFASKKGDDGKPMTLPKRCPDCRAKKKAQKNSPFAPAAREISRHESGHGRDFLKKNNHRYKDRDED